MPDCRSGVRAALWVLGPEPSLPLGAFPGYSTSWSPARFGGSVRTMGLSAASRAPASRGMGGKPQAHGAAVS